MDYDDVITALIALVAVIISLVLLHRTGKFNEVQHAFQKEADRLNRLQRQLLERDEANKTKSNVSAYIYCAASDYRLGIINNGKVLVRDVNIP